MTYAADTKVPVDRSKAEIERTLQRYGCDQFAYGWAATGAAFVAFKARDRTIQFQLPLPGRHDRDITHTETGRARTDAQAQAAYEQACRSRWRSLALVIKAKLDAVETGIVTFEDEFLAHTMLPSGQSFGDWARPQVDHIYTSGQMPAQLALGPGTAAAAAASSS